MFTSDLHPRVAAGSAGGGQFAPKGGSSSSTTTAKSGSKKAPAKKTTQPNGLGYSATQWAQLQKLEAMAKAGKKLDAHQQHELHVAHQKRLAAMGNAPKPTPKPTPKPKKTAAKPKAKAGK